MLLLFSITTNAYALPDCPSDTSKLWDKCFGTINLNNGDKYVGEWKDDKKHGQGTYTFGNESQWAGGKYVGEWKDDKKHGQGAYTFGNQSQWAGDKYVGEFIDDKKIQGTYTFASGDKYVGEWKGNKKHGQGTYTFANGEQREGYYLNDKYIPSTCEAMGLVKGSSEFGQCIITLINKL